MRHANFDFIERRLPDLPKPVNVEPEESEKPSGPPTEGMRNITAIVGMAAASMSGLAQMGSSPIALGNVAAGNNATMPPASQRVSGLNAGALAGLASGLAQLGGAKKAAPNNNPAPQKDSKPTPPSETKPSSPTPAAPSQDDSILEPAWKETRKAKTIKANPKSGTKQAVHPATAADSSPSKVACDPQAQSCPQQAVSIAAPSAPVPAEPAAAAAGPESSPAAAVSDPMQSVPESAT